MIPSKTTINWLFSDIWCYLFIAYFNWKIGVSQQTVVRVYYILNDKSHFRKFNWIQLELGVESCIGTSLLYYWNRYPTFSFNCIFPPFFDRYNTRSQIVRKINILKIYIFSGTIFLVQNKSQYQGSNNHSSFTHKLEKQFLKILKI